MTLTDAVLDDLETKARSLDDVAPGPWEHALGLSGFVMRSPSGELVAMAQTIQARDFIAAANPMTVGALVDEVRQLREQVKTAQAEAASAQQDVERSESYARDVIIGRPRGGKR